ncbi:riboflavin synthase [Candidatus Omnitrophota bacterium]
MFTGIIEETAIIEGISKKANTYRLALRFRKTPEEIKIGDSVSVNGACLTVVEIKNNVLSFDIMGETFRNTSFRYARNGNVVNTERSLKSQSRIEGHFVSGHVDAAKKIRSIKRVPNPSIEVPVAPGDKRYVAKKGSIAIDGISLTIGDVREGSITAYIIPHTLESTNLKFKKPGDWVNVEFDILAKYVQDRPKGQKSVSPGVTEKLLKNNGFI